jgi:hypothetical protein
MKPRFTFDPREVDDFVRKLDPRRELIYRFAIRGPCTRCRGDRAFRARTVANWQLLDSPRENDRHQLRKPMPQRHLPRIHGILRAEPGRGVFW